LTPGGTIPRGRARADSTLVKALARAFRWRKVLEGGRYGTIDEFAAGERINSAYVSRVMRLTLLAPGRVDRPARGICERRPPSWKDGATHPAAGRVVTGVAGVRA
jgi:hypothetical protein